MLTDYHLIKEAFQKVELSSRYTNTKLQKVSKLTRIDAKIAKMGEKIFGEDDVLVRNGDCGCEGMAVGHYNEFHRLMRSAYYKTSNRASKRQLGEILKYNSNQVIDLLIAANEKPIDPIEIFKLATMNIVTEFTVGKKYEFSDPDFKVIFKSIETIMNNIDSRIKSKVFHVRIS